MAGWVGWTPRRPRGSNSCGSSNNKQRSALHRDPAYLLRTRFFRNWLFNDQSLPRPPGRAARASGVSTFRTTPPLTDRLTACTKMATEQHGGARLGQEQRQQVRSAAPGAISRAATPLTEAPRRACSSRVASQRHLPGIIWLQTNALASSGRGRHCRTPPVPAKLHPSECK